MEDKINIGILGYGNLGRGVELAIDDNPDMELVAVFTRREPKDVRIISRKVEILHISKIPSYKDKIDVMILCGGSATDLPEQGPMALELFNTIDSYDNHGKIPEYFDEMKKAAMKGQKLGIISVGWDPGLFSINRVIEEAIIPKGKTYTFWGEGVSQGHSDALRRIEGVKDAVQYTIPIEEALIRVREGDSPNLSNGDRHIRHCYVVAQDGADKDIIEKKIKTMPGYFADYKTKVNFIDEEELKKEHSGMPHGGRVIRSGRTGVNKDNSQVMEFSLNLGSNPEFTGSVLVAYARAAYRLSKDGQVGARTVLDIPPSYLSIKPDHELRREFL